MKILRNCILVLTFMLHSPAFAGDEDMNPTAYSVFDPVTGYMIPADQLPLQEHSPATSPTNETATPGTQMPAGQAMTTQASSTEEPEQSPMWMYLVAGALILGGFAAWVRNKGKVSKSNLD